MSCDRHWKLLLGGFRSLVQGLYISKVKSKLYARPILSFTPSFCCENIVSFVLPLSPNTHAHISTLPLRPSPLVWNEPFHLNPNQSQWDQWVVHWRNMAMCPSLIPTALRLISQPLRITHWANCLCLQATLCLIVWFISEEEDEELSEWQACVCLRVCIEGWRNMWNTCNWLEISVVQCHSNIYQFITVDVLK